MELSPPPPPPPPPMIYHMTTTVLGDPFLRHLCPVIQCGFWCRTLAEWLAHTATHYNNTPIDLARIKHAHVAHDDGGGCGQPSAPPLAHQHQQQQQQQQQLSLLLPNGRVIILPPFQNIMPHRKSSSKPAQQPVVPDPSLPYYSAFNQYMVENMLELKATAAQPRPRFFPIHRYTMEVFQPIVKPTDFVTSLPPTAAAAAAGIYQPFK